VASALSVPRTSLAVLLAVARAAAFSKRALLAARLGLPARA
jgi:hypothetical protein